MKRFLSVAVFALVAGTGCARDTDVGRDCQMVKALSDGGVGADPVLRSDITNPAQDTISFGALDCEDLVCVRASNSPLPASATSPVFGKCSRACAAGTKCESYDANLDKDPATAFTCRSLLLDPETLQGLQSNPAFRDRTNPYFCAQAPQDAGT